MTHDTGLTSPQQQEAGSREVKIEVSKKYFCANINQQSLHHIYLIICHLEYPANVNVIHFVLTLFKHLIVVMSSKHGEWPGSKEKGWCRVSCQADKGNIGAGEGRQKMRRQKIRRSLLCVS